MVGREMNNEPVAWINLDRFKDEALYLADCVSENKVDNMGITIPLYTHPAKTLTDEEIAEIAMQCSDMDGYGHSQLKEYEFARAILRKAQEK
jgi:hypothetical protein